MYASAADRNKHAIYEVIRKYINGNTKLLEIASGTGQHVAYFAQKFPETSFQPTDVEETYLHSINTHVKQTGVQNVMPAKFLDVTTSSQTWLDGSITPGHFQYIYNSNMVHITDFRCAIGLFKGSGYCLKTGGCLFMYGPFSNNGVITPESNLNFNQSLRNHNAAWGLRDIEIELKPTASVYGLQLIDIVPMPANNHTLVWQKIHDN